MREGQRGLAAWQMATLSPLGSSWPGPVTLGLKETALQGGAQKGEDAANMI